MVIMASSSILMTRAASSSLLKRLINSSNSNILRSVSATRSFNTNATQVSNFDDNPRYDVDRRSDSTATRRRDPDFFSDVFDPFVPRRSLSQVLNLMDQFMDNPFLTASRGMGAGSRRSWDVKEKEDALYLRMDMPGLGKEDVKVSMEQNTLTIRGEGKNSDNDDDEEEGSGRRFSSRIDLPPKLYRVDQIKAEMKNGVLKVVVPKVKEEERNGVVQINVE